jgi:hypothetical protein
VAHMAHRLDLPLEMMHASSAIKHHFVNLPSREEDLKVTSLYFSGDGDATGLMHNTMGRRGGR